MSRNGLIVGLILVSIAFGVSGCGKAKTANIPAPDVKPTATDSADQNQPEEQSKASQAAEGEGGWLKDDELNLAGVSLIDQPNRIKEVWGTPTSELTEVDYVDSVVWRYKLDGDIQLDFLVNPNEGWILSITGELPEGWEGGPLPEKVRIATSRNIRLGDTVEQLEKAYGAWTDAGDGLLYTTSDMAVGLKIGVTSGRITRIFLFVAD